MDAALFLKSLV